MAIFDRYRPSGKCAPTTLLFAAGAGIPAALVLAWAYQSFVGWNSFFYVNLLATCGLAFGLGWILAQMLRREKCRNPVAALALGASCGLLAEVAAFKLSYDQFTTGQVALFDKMIEGLERQPRDPNSPLPEGMVDELKKQRKTVEEYRQELGMGRYLEARAELGWQVSRRGKPIQVNGFMVWLIWLIEALIIVGTPARLAWSASRLPFCERCEAWMDEKPLPPVASVDMESMKRATAAGDLPSLLKPANQEGSPHSALYVLRTCLRCRGDSYVTVKLSWVETKGRNSGTKELVLVKDAVFSEGAQADALAVPEPSPQAASVEKVPSLTAPWENVLR